MATADLVIDRQRLMDSTQGDPDFMAELADVFIGDAHSRARDLVQAAAAQDLDTIKKLAHRLRGSSASVGAYQVMSMAINLELLAAKGDLQALTALAQDLSPAIVQAARALQWLVESCRDSAA